MKTKSHITGCAFLLALLLSGCGKQAVRVGPEADAHGADSPDSVPSDQDTTPPNTPSEFIFPTDKGGQLLAEKLRPANQITPLPANSPAQSKSRYGPPAVENPDLPLPATAIPGPSSIPNPKAKPVRPALIHREPPLFRQRIELADPDSVKLPAGPRIAWPSPDVNQPIPLPILARQVHDRASLDDPSGEASLAAALAPTVPDRTTPAPFLKLNLPDPFEHRNAVRLRKAPPEISLPRDTPRALGQK
jgi:hypothetical protein